VCVCVCVCVCLSAGLYSESYKQIIVKCLEVVGLETRNNQLNLDPGICFHFFNVANVSCTYAVKLSANPSVTVEKSTTKKSKY